MTGLCGQLECKRLCSRSQYCPLGQERVRKLLAQQREHREARRLVVGQVRGLLSEANVSIFAGSFAAFQRQLRSERQSLQRQNTRVDPGFTYDEFLGNLKDEGG